MKKITCLIIGFLLCGMSVLAENLVIESFDSAGQITFNHITNATSYRVEWAPSPGEPWQSSWSALRHIPAPISGSVTCSVAMCYRVVAELGIVMVRVPAGSNAGTNPLGTVWGNPETYSQSYPENYSLTVDSFYMDATAITKTQWDQVYNWAMDHGYIFDNPGSGKDENHPVHSVSWYDCVKWCNARSQRDGLTPCYTVSNSVYKTGQSIPDCDFNVTGYRLPKTDEWEYAARGGLGSQRYPWGNTITHSNGTYFSHDKYDYDVSSTRGSHPDYHILSSPFTSPVGIFEPNGYGLHGMANNMMTWCWEPSYTTARHNRGGASTMYAESARCGRINWNSATDSEVYLGLRAVRRWFP